MTQTFRFPLRLAQAFCVFAFLAASVPSFAQKLSVTIPSLSLADKEQIVGFEIHVQSGMIAQLPNAPRGWAVSIDNDPSWKTRVSVSLIVGAAALNTDFFRDFLRIEKDT